MFYVHSVFFVLFCAAVSAQSKQMADQKEAVVQAKDEDSVVKLLLDANSSLIEIERFTEAELRGYGEKFADLHVKSCGGLRAALLPFQGKDRLLELRTTYALPPTLGGAVHKRLFPPGSLSSLLLSSLPSA